MALLQSVHEERRRISSSLCKARKISLYAMYKSDIFAAVEKYNFLTREQTNIPVWKPCAPAEEERKDDFRESSELIGQHVFGV
jgi:hypothetical protein